MGSMAQDAIDMGIDPVIAPGGNEWCESSHRQSDLSKEMWGNLQECGSDQNSSFDIKNEEMVVKELNIGDTVRLNSSLILMTIRSIDDNEIICRWFDKNHTLLSDRFNIKEVQLVKKIALEEVVNNNDEQIVPIIDIDEDEIPF